VRGLGKTPGVSWKSTMLSRLSGQGGGRCTGNSVFP